MLILNRKVNETIVIGDNEIRVTVCGIQNGSVRLGIDAPNEILINREEVFDRIQSEVEMKGAVQP